MAKAKEEIKEEAKTPALPLPNVLKKKSMFSGGSMFGGHGPVQKFTPKTFRITQHKGG